MELTVVISYYRAISNLKIILKALNQQSNKNFEVILSEDDYNMKTFEYISQNKQIFDFPIIHIHQKEDKGFRKNLMLNKSVSKANSERLAFIDGDCIPHKHFVKEYVRCINDGFFYSGRAVMLGEKISNDVVKTQSLQKLNLFSLLFSHSQKIKDGIYSPRLPLSYKKSRGLVGRNWGVLKKHLIDINGFDNDYVHAGVGEDVDIEWRLLENGVKRKSMKNKAIVYHIHHPRNYSDNDVKHNFEILNRKKQDKFIKCLNGIETN